MIFYLVFEDPQGVDGGREASEDESCTNCAALQEELKLCKAKAAQDLQRLKEDADEEREREVLERKILQLNNDLCHARKVEKQTTSKSMEKQSRPTDCQPRTSGSCSIVATSVNEAVGMYYDYNNFLIDKYLKIKCFI